MKRCDWCLKDDMYKNYHDTEWGIPCKDDAKLFEYLVLESFQAGLSWYTILVKREGFKTAFCDFNAEKIAAFTEADVLNLMQDTGIVRNLLKIQATINNAKMYLHHWPNGGFAKYLWSFVNNETILSNLPSMKEVVAKTPISDAMAKDLKQKGFKFMGSTTCYAFMQAVGMVNDHLNYCFKK